jgi:kynurenine formamidase
MTENREPGAAARRRLIELNHAIDVGMITYPGMPGPRIVPHLTREASRGHYAEGTEFAIDRIDLVGNTGTYLDSPFHRYADGVDLAAIELERIADVPVAVVDVSGSRTRGIEPVALADVEVAGRAVLLRTGWDVHWGTAHYLDLHAAPFLTEAGASLLAESGAALVGIDSVNIDDASGNVRPAHTILLGAGVPILEHLTGIEQLPPTGARLHAAPPRFHGFGTFPTRAYAVLE